MTPDKVREVMAIYRKRFEEAGIEKKKLLDASHNSYSLNSLQHCYAMLDEIDVFIQEARMDKVFRWLGFIQGCLWSHGVYTLDDLKNHNRP
ncbi:MAG: Uncharacterized protein G01um10143_522 [Parcubacteria group bacterium Gr01-1014_3]|nr:MAG: Uncharacterized protein G01um10143_522 [Parcubacteria group bacterium Gr01-1014_3]